MRTSIAFAAAAALACLAAAPALAGAVSFVSVTGDDTRNCATPATACRTFQRAHNATSPHGEIIALTPGDFRPLTIAKSISVTGVDGAGIFGGTSNYQIEIAAGASAVVYLTGLTLDGASAAFGAIDVQSAGAVTIRNCAARNMTGFAINASGPTLVENTTIAAAGVDNLRVSNNALVHRVVSTNATASGIVADDDKVVIAESSMSGGVAGLYVFNSAHITRSTITGARAGIDGGRRSSAFSGGDNFIRGNGTDVDIPLNTIGLK
jgi:hypothetical protein